MKYLDWTFADPAENLACEEVLAEALEAGSGVELLRFWESASYFVVVGYGNRPVQEVNLSACADLGFPVYRRVSGGGTVVQGPGCLNYALVLRVPESGPLLTIPHSNRHIMDRNCAAIQSLLAGPVHVRGTTDLASQEMKFSGNAQRRWRHTILFHGTLLLDFDLGLIEKLLPMPSRQPMYRHARTHSQFITNLGLSRDAVKRALMAAWGATEPLPSYPAEQIRHLAREKYQPLSAASAV